VPHKDKATYHNAEYLAREMGQDETNMFKDEYIFEWEVLEKYIVYEVLVQTLLERRLNMERYCKYSNNKRQLLPAYLLRQDIAKHILNPATVASEIGFRLEHFKILR